MMPGMIVLPRTSIRFAPAGTGTDDAGPDGRDAVALDDDGAVLDDAGCPESGPARPPS